MIVLSTGLSIWTSHDLKCCCPLLLQSFVSKLTFQHCRGGTKTLKLQPSDSPISSFENCFSLQIQILETTAFIKVFMSCKGFFPYTCIRCIHCIHIVCDPHHDDFPLFSPQQLLSRFDTQTSFEVMLWDAFGCHGKSKTIRF